MCLVRTNWMEKIVFKIKELKALKANCSNELSEDATCKALISSKFSIKVVGDQPSSSAFQNLRPIGTNFKVETPTTARNNAFSLNNQNNQSAIKKSSLNNNNTSNQKSNPTSIDTPNISVNTNNNSNSSAHKKLTIAQQRLLFEKEREEILKSRERGNVIPEKDGEPAIRKYHDESDEIMKEFQNEARKVDLMYEKNERKQTETAISSNMNNMQTDTGSLLSPTTARNRGFDTWLADIFNKPITGEDFSFDMANATKDTETSSLFQFDNHKNDSSDALHFSGSHSKQSRLGSILGINAITLSPDKPSTKSSRSFARDDDDDNNTLEVVNSIFSRGLHLNGLMSDISPMRGSNTTIPPRYDMPTNSRVDLNSVFLSVQNDSYLVQTVAPDMVVKSTDVLSKLGFNGPEQVDDLNTQAGKSSFSFQDNSSSANKKKSKTPVMSAASRLQLNKMKSSSKTTSQTDSSTPNNLSSSIETKSSQPSKPIEVNSSKSPMQRLNINALFEAAATNTKIQKS